jgi:isopenicillin-N N-acyltransferase-like protein
MNNLIVVVYLCVAVLSLLFRRVDSAFCHGSPSPTAQQNNNTIDTAQPIFVRSVQNSSGGNASLFVVGHGDDQISLVHLWGTAYQKGYAHGTLMRKPTVEFVQRAFQFFEEQFQQAINSSVPWIPPKMAAWVAKVGLEVALDLTADATKAFTGAYFFEEMQGMADATGLDYKMIRRVHMIGELTKGSCSMYGAWGGATADGNTLQMRALDWDTSGPFQDYPQVTVYHKSSSESVDGRIRGNEEATFANVGWTGWIGSITGMSESQTAISEIGVSFPDSTFGKESRFGVPFTFILRDILQFDTTLDDAMKHIKGASRTCDLILGVGDGKVDSKINGAPFRGVQYSHSVANFFDDKNMEPANDTWHAKIDSMVYYGMDWLCPNYSVVLHRQLAMLHGSLSVAKTIQEVVPIVQTGDLHIAIYDLTKMMMYIANAKSASETGPAMAYDRQFIQLNMTKIFMVEQQQH